MFHLFSPPALKLCSSVPGRQRWRLRGIYNDDSFSRDVEEYCRRYVGVLSVTTNTVTGSLLILFDTHIVNEERVKLIVSSFLRSMPATTEHTSTATTHNEDHGVLAEHVEHHKRLPKESKLNNKKAIVADKTFKGVTQDTALGVLYHLLGVSPKKIRHAKILSVVNVLVDLLPSFGLVQIINSARNQNSRLLAGIGIRSMTAQFAVVGLATMGLFTFALYITYKRKNAWRELSSDIEQKIKVNTFNHIQHLDMSFIDANNQGRLTKYIIEDADKVKAYMSNSAAELIRRAVFSSSLLAILFVLSPSLGVVSFLPLPIILLSSIAFKKPMQKAYEYVQINSGNLNQLINNNLSGLVTVKSFTAEDDEKLRLEHVVHDISNSENKAFETSMRFVNSSQLLFFGGWVASLAYGGQLLSRSALSQNAFSTLIYMIPQLVENFYGLDELFDSRQKAQQSAMHLVELLQQPINFIDGHALLPANSPSKYIEFKKIAFEYNDSTPLFDALDLQIPANKITAIVGSTGSGKSTVLKLLMRLYDTQNGSITIDGIDHKSLQIKHFRQMIGYVSQDVYLFNGSIKDNIAYGHKQASFDDIVAAATLAEATSFIEQLPQGYETIVGDNGTKLSGGQRQRISIARAMLKNPRILILDEATSAVDNETELAIARAIQAISVGRTTIIIAHRLSTIRNAHVINVLDNGRVIESGTHSELLQNKGLYANLWNVQTGEPIEYLSH